jgi:alkanesulfonate monooxygenase SsuD/methylene tetrahydromethanopterin reductase-like flavin-dependent oxidoreductase (luciferase family)
VFEKASLTMQFGAWIPSFTYPNLDYERVRKGVDTFARKANGYGIDLWTIDHLLHAPGLYGMAWLEPLHVCTWAAAVAPDVLIGTGILVLPIRHPVVLAKEVATLDFLYGGRFQFGIGPGWYGPEFEATGSSLKERGRRTDEMMSLIRRLLTEEAVTFDGEFYSVTDLSIEPRPPKMPAVWVAGGSRIPDGAYDNDVPVLAKSVKDRILSADWWLSRCSGKQEWVKRDWELIQSEAAKAGTAPPRFGHTNFVYLVDTDDSARAKQIQHRYFEQVMGTHRERDHLEQSYLFGSIDEIVERIVDLRDAGCEYIVLGPTSDEPEQLDMLAELVMPRVND